MSLWKSPGGDQKGPKDGQRFSRVSRLTKVRSWLAEHTPLGHEEPETQGIFLSPCSYFLSKLL